MKNNYQVEKKWKDSYLFEDEPTHLAFLPLIKFFSASLGNKLLFSCSVKNSY